MAHVPLVSASLAVAATLVCACSKSESSGAEARAADSTASAAKPTERRVSMVMIGKKLGSGNRVTDPTFQFAPKDTVYISVGTEGTVGPNTVTAAWRSQTGEIVQQSSEAVPAAAENAAFHWSQPKGMKPGTYKVVVFLGDDSADAKVFVVKK